MSPTFERIQELVAAGALRISDHALDEAIEEAISPANLARTMADAECIEDYPDYWRGPCCLALHWIDGDPVHAVWGIPKGASEPAVLVTTYRPQEARWLDARTRRGD